MLTYFVCSCICNTASQVLTCVCYAPWSRVWWRTWQSSLACLGSAITSITGAMSWLELWLESLWQLWWSAFFLSLQYSSLFRFQALHVSCFFSAKNKKKDDEERRKHSSPQPYTNSTYSDSYVQDNNLRPDLQENIPDAPHNSKRLSNRHSEYLWFLLTWCKHLH
jgi:hypothetical protein